MTGQKVCRKALNESDPLDTGAGAIIQRASNKLDLAVANREDANREDSEQRHGIVSPKRPRAAPERRPPFGRATMPPRSISATSSKSLRPCPAQYPARTRVLAHQQCLAGASCAAPLSRRSSPRSTSCSNSCRAMPKGKSPSRSRAARPKNQAPTFLCRDACGVEDRRFTHAGANLQ